MPKIFFRVVASLGSRLQWFTAYCCSLLHTLFIGVLYRRVSILRRTKISGLHQIIFYTLLVVGQNQNVCSFTTYNAVFPHACTFVSIPKISVSSKQFYLEILHIVYISRYILVPIILTSTHVSQLRVYIGTIKLLAEIVQ